MIRNIYELYSLKLGEILDETTEAPEAILRFCTTRESYLNCVDGDRVELKNALKRLLNCVTVVSALAKIKTHFEAEFFTKGMERKSFCVPITALDFLQFILSILKDRNFRAGKSIQFRFYHY